MAEADYHSFFISTALRRCYARRGISVGGGAPTSGAAIGCSGARYN